MLVKFLTLLDSLDAQVKAVYLDRGFYNSDCLELLYTHNYAYAMSIVKGVRQSKTNSARAQAA